MNKENSDEHLCGDENGVRKFQSIRRQPEPARWRREDIDKFAGDLFLWDDMRNNTLVEFMMQIGLLTIRDDTLIVQLKKSSRALAEDDNSARFIKPVLRGPHLQKI